MAYVNCECDSCGLFSLCVIVHGEFDEQSVLCEWCVDDMNGEPDAEDDRFYGDDIEDDIDDDFDYDSPEDDGDMYGRDDDNPISLGAYDE